MKSLLEGATVGAIDRGEERTEVWAWVPEKGGLYAGCLADAVHVVGWGKAQEADPPLAACRRWLCTCKDTPLPKWDALLKWYLGKSVDTEEGQMLFHMRNCHKVTGYSPYFWQEIKGLPGGNIKHATWCMHDDVSMSWLHNPHKRPCAIIPLYTNCLNSVRHTPMLTVR